MVKSFVLIVITLTLVTSCNEETARPDPQFRLFDNQTLSYNYYYDFEGWEQLPLLDLQLQLVAGLKVNDKVYCGFSYYETQIHDFDLSNDDDILDFNFLPIRYENGNYYEFRRYYELVVLKDDLRLGDSWEQSFEVRDGETITHKFKLIDIKAVYQAGSHQYENVFQIKETIHANDSGTDDGITSMHFYSHSLGIIRREIPMYISGTYGPIVFNRTD